MATSSIYLFNATKLDGSSIGAPIGYYISSISSDHEDFHHIKANSVFVAVRALATVQETDFWKQQSRKEMHIIKQYNHCNNPFIHFFFFLFPNWRFYRDN